MAAYLQVNGDVIVNQITHSKKDLLVDGDLIINGVLTTINTNAVIVEKLTVDEITNLNELLDPYFQKLYKRLDDIEEKLKAVWHAPNMPGYDEAKQEFESMSLSIPKIKYYLN